MYYFYILYSKTIDKYYIGQTSNLEERIRQHNRKHKGFTGKRDDWEVVYSEDYETKGEASARELQVKRWKNRQRIETLIQKKSTAG